MEDGGLSSSKEGLLDDLQDRISSLFGSLLSLEELTGDRLVLRYARTSSISSWQSGSFDDLGGSFDDLGGSFDDLGGSFDADEESLELSLL